MKIRCAYDKMVPIEDLKPNPRNRNKHPQSQVEHLSRIFRAQGIRKPIIVSKRSGLMTIGHGRLLAAQLLKMKTYPVNFQDYDDEAQEYADMVADNAVALQAEIDLAGISLDVADLGPDFNMDLLGIEGFSLDHSQEATAASGPTLTDKFMVPPFSVLDQRQGYWRERKQHWMSLGIKSEEGRGANLLKMSDTILQPDPKKRAKTFGKVFGTEGNIAGDQTGTSIFDPVLCELIYRWFSNKGALVLDPFAGGSVRGIVASKLGRPYYGSELRKEQVEANQTQAKQICRGAKPMPVWVCQDSRDLDKAKIQADLIFSCPPYADLEVYSDDPRDISNMPYRSFLDVYREIIAKSVAKLRQDRFACFVVSEVREKKGGGYYRNFVPDTIRAFEDAGARFYNEAILVNSVGTLALRAGKTFSASRKLGRTHQNILIFCKGDPMKAAKECGQVEVSLPEESPAALSE